MIRYSTARAVRRATGWLWLFPLVLVCSGCRPHTGTLNIYFAGDLLLDRGVRRQIDLQGADAIFDRIKPVFSHADAVVVNLECPVTARVAPVSKKYVFRGDPGWLQALRAAGITHCVMANNHSYDEGRGGLRDTYDNLSKTGLMPIGGGADSKKACAPVIIDKNGVRAAIFASVLLPLESWMCLPDSACMCQASAQELAEAIKRYRAANPHDKIIAVLHWGVEYREKPQATQRQQAEMLIDAGADAIVGCHPHVVQQQAWYKGKPIFYSIGNFIFDQQYPPAQRGIVVWLSLSDHGDSAAVLPFAIRNCAPAPDSSGFVPVR